ncbi:MAG TPA: MFS transporter [Saprospiraceae bacterium]|jgi:MFS family permease|nr:MAG: major facilitator superfamily protein [Candidatus Parvibacillus calidus]MBX2936771.1 MFS transporter [Saprospiraceae bacterium]MBK7739580.1 MFS transporter [Candidatus Parvibacillus calidus]MBX7180203.1 MFS transporter [Saprospiraceae bacterium]MCC7148354.1 MFS transporter [Saprospiraceae bacterium]
MESGKETANVYRNREFRIYLATRFLMTFGIQMQNVITGWYLYELTKDPLILGMVGLSEALPALSSALFAGDLVDKFDKRKVLIIAFSVYLVCGIGFTFLGTQYAASLSHQLVVWGFYGISMLLGLARAFATPASFSILSYLFPLEMLPKAAPASSTAWQVGAILGPATGGFVYALTDAPSSSFVVCLFMLSSVILASFLSPKPPYEEKKREEQSRRQRISEGIRYVFSNKVILSAITLDLFAVLFGGATAILPAFASEILHVGAVELGWLRAAPSVGSAILLFLLSIRPPESKSGIKLLLAVTGFGLCMIAFSLSTNLWLSIFFLFASGAFDAVSVVIRSTILQIYTPDHMRGRVSAVNTMFVGSSNEIGAFESGTAARLLGTAPSVLIGGSITLLVVALVARFAPTLRKLELNTIKLRE